MARTGSSLVNLSICHLAKQQASVCLFPSLRQVGTVQELESAIVCPQAGCPASDTSGTTHKSMNNHIFHRCFVGAKVLICSSRFSGLSASKSSCNGLGVPRLKCWEAVSPKDMKFSHVFPQLCWGLGVRLHYKTLGSLWFVFLFGVSQKIWT